MTVLVERLVYYEDVDRAGEIIFSLLHIDLTSNILALQLHVFPWCLADEGKEPCQADGGTLGGLPQHEVQHAVLQSRPQQMSWSTLTCIVIQPPIQPPIPLPAMTSQQSSGCSSESDESRGEAAHRGLFSLLVGIGMEPVLTPRLEFVCHILEQAAFLGSA